MDSSGITAGEASEYGFDRPEMFSSSLSDTVSPYDRHVFLCYNTHEAWPSNVEDSDADPLPKLLSSALKARKDDISLKTRLTICARYNENESSDGDVLIFPEMVKYRGLEESDVDAFVDDVIVNGKPWASRVPENLVGAYVFVCAHASRDKRCGVCGPVLIEKFKEEIGLRGLNDQAFVTACSHVGGHKYAGNVIIFGKNAEGKVTGDWYGYVTPSDVPDLLDVHIGKGEIIERLYRGQMGLKEKNVEKKEEHELQKENGPIKSEEKPQEIDSESDGKKETNDSCCQGSNGVSCCRDVNSGLNGQLTEVKLKKTSEVSLPGWMGSWEQSDVLMAAAVIGAVATVAVAYSVFRRST